MQITKCTEKDACAIAQMEIAYIECPWSEKTISESIQNPLYSFFKAEEDGFMGYIGVEYCLDEGNICNVAVDEHYRRRGVASALLYALEKDAKERGVTKLFLEVNEKNIGAIALYKKLGFTQISARKNYYGKESALILRKEIKE